MSALACNRDATRRTRDSTVDSATPRVETPPRRTDWSSELGQLLVVPSDSDDAAVVLYPDEPNAQLIATRPATLLDAAGDTVRVQLAVADSQQCGDAALVRFAGKPPLTWSVGLLGQTGAIIRMDSIEALSSADSARLAADLARLASGLSTHRESRFSGLPFAVLDAHRFDVDRGQVLVAHLVRRLNQEAAPLEERTLLVAERPTRAEPYVASYSERSEGAEDSAQHYELLAAIRGRSSILLVVARDDEAATDYEVIERSASGSWRARWSRRLAC